MNDKKTARLKELEENTARTPEEQVEYEALKTESEAK